MLHLDKINIFDIKNVFLLLLSFTIAGFSQKFNKITTRKCIPKKGFHLKLVKVLSDSHCPEGVTCVWAGKVSVIVALYNDKQLLEEKTIIFNSKKMKRLLNGLIIIIRRK